MSTISSRHSVLPFVSGTSKAFTEQRLVKVGYKNTKNAVARFPSVCVSVPVITEIDESHLDRLLPFVVELLENAQDGIVKSLYESSEGALREVSDEEICIDSCISFLESVRRGTQGLTKELIGEWFDEFCVDNLTMLLTEKLGSGGDLSRHIKGYREVLASLASPKTSLTPVQIKSCKVVLAGAEDTEVGDWLGKKLVALEKEQTRVPELLELD